MRGWIWGAGLVVMLASLGCEDMALGERREGVGRESNRELPRLLHEPRAGAGESAPHRVYLAPASGATAEGRATLTARADGVWLVLDSSSAPPGKHGVHIHEKADCSGTRAENAGEHFAPDGNRHGLPTDAEHHLGDLGNVVVDRSGRGRLELLVAGANLRAEDPRSLLGRSIVLGAHEDTGTQQASREPERRIACGPIPR
jgi:Cu-Zn family superoxide dismutase